MSTSGIETNEAVMGGQCGGLAGCGHRFHSCLYEVA
jgi:hypothetical protein